jgi:hypothetical protein
MQPMFLTVARPGFAARSMGCEMKHEETMPIRIRRHDKTQHGTQVGDIENIIASVFVESTAH